ncbi:ABC transporter ATP-binding protein [Lichenifustis flavocetrariae]|uniref:ABC transporter ATP-binding protein n=1 Tax=Lichenifustis flavocetrariae TaxID=2949735 RepID=A0AA42CH46_9HYPH|nr:ABC transporter ATP-binding protein [Lichenifustis flavocetrariae]MCW6507203.1 ABC transporter ATP-binding protein [Lichenifustis flavocetrariae]
MTLRVSNLCGWYGQAQILFEVALDVGPGSVVALLGRNGAGKTTTFRSIAGLVPRREGVVVFGDQDVSRLPTYEIVRRGLAFVPEDRRIFTDLTVEENLEVGRQPPRLGVPHWTPERLYELFPNLAAMRRRLGGRMSGGEQQMLTIARSLMGNPRLVLLDEPSEGLAPKIVEDMAHAIVAMKREGLSILLSEQNLHFARLISDAAVVIESGHVRFAGPMAELVSHPDVYEAYLAV